LKPKIQPRLGVRKQMGHSERTSPGLYRNVPGQYDLGLFRSAARYFK